MIKTAVYSSITVVVLLACGMFTSAQALDPMRLGIRTDLPGEVKTVGQASQYFADAIGYQLVTQYPAPEESAVIAAETISPLSITSGIKPVEEAIISLLRSGCNLVIDHEHKLFSFEHREGVR
jgi:hypothetical protein